MKTNHQRGFRGKKHIIPKDASYTVVGGRKAFATYTHAGLAYGGHRQAASSKRAAKSKLRRQLRHENIDFNQDQ